jgi:hypothetical protein
MQAPDVFLGLTATGWTAVGSIVGGLSILILTIYNYAYLGAALRGINVQVKALEFQVHGIVFSNCPVLIIRTDDEQNSFIHNCGLGPAFMVQWGYGHSVLEIAVLERLEDNVIPAGDSRPAEIDWELARNSGLILFAYGVTNDRFVTKMAWSKDGIERFVHFGTYEGKLKNEAKSGKWPPDRRREDSALRTGAVSR